MFHRSFGWFICIFVAVVIATENSQPDSATEPATAGAADRDHQAAGGSGSTPATGGSATTTSTQPRPGGNHSRTAVAAATCPTLTPNDTAISLLRNLSGDEKGIRLIDAARRGAVEELQALLAAGADVEARDENTWTALHSAAWEGHVQAAGCLLASGADVGARNDEEDTPLHMAAHNGSAALVRLLAGSSADLNARNGGGWTPLHWAAAYGNVEAATALLEAGANKQASTNEESEWGLKPLDLARRYNHQQLIDILT